MANAKAIRHKIAEVIRAQATKVAPEQVYASEESRFSGYPAVIVTLSDKEADYATTSKEKAGYTYIVRAHVPIEKTGHLAADDLVDDVIDELHDIFRDRTALGDVCEWVEPAASVPGYQDREIGQVRTREIKLRCVAYE